MSSELLLAWAKDRMTIVVLVALCICRVFEFFAFAPAMFVNLSLAQGYGLINNLGLACFAFVPLFGLLLVYTAKIFFNEIVVVSHCRHRKILALRCLQCSFQQSACYAAVLNISTLPLLFMQYQTVLDFLPLMLLSFVLQTLFFTICAMLFFFLFMATHTTTVAYMAVLIYGLWDFMASNVVGGGVTSVGWNLVFIQFPVVWMSILSKFSFLAMLVCLSFFAMLLVVERMDFLTKREA